MDERDKFISWLKTQKAAGAGSWIFASLSTMQGFFPPKSGAQKAWYDYWVALGKPSAPEAEPETASWADMTAEEKQAALTDPSREPYKLPSEMDSTWKWLDYNPETGEPTATGQWVKMPVEEEEGENWLAELKKKAQEISGATGISADEALNQLIAQYQGVSIPRDDSLAREQFEWQKELADREYERDKLATQYAVESRQAAEIYRTLGTQSERDRENLQRQMQEGEWEKIRSQLAGQLQSSPRDWISHFRAVNAPNPYASQPRNMADEIAGLAEDVKQYKSAEKIAIDIEKRYPAGEVPAQIRQAIDAAQKATTHAEERYLNLTSEFNTGKELGQMGLTQNEAEKAIREEYGRAPTEAEKEGWLAGPRPMEGGGSVLGRESESQPKSPTMPEIPTWLQQVSGLTGRVPETRTQVVTPSAQQWTRLMPEQQQMYAGLVDWAGEDTYLTKMTQMQQQIPKALTLGKRWAPARQV